MIANFVNLLLCFGIGWSAMCRLGAMHRRVKLHVELWYLALFVLSVVSGLRFFFFGHFAGWADVAIASVLCLLLAVTVGHWRTGPPPRCLRGLC